jgi:hypothetical protein
VVPHTKATGELARRMAARSLAAGIRIALVDEKGRITEIVDRGEEPRRDLPSGAQWML